MIVAKRHNSLEYRQTVEYISTDRLILDLTHQERFDKIQKDTIRFEIFSRMVLYTGFLRWT